VKNLDHYSKFGCDVFPIIVPAQNLKTINFFLVKHESGLSLIDAGLDNEDCWNALQTQLKKNDLELKDLTEIILTHHHFDHVGLVNRIVSIHPIPVFASPLSIPRLKRDPHYMENRVNFYEQVYKEMGCGELGDKQIHYLRKSIKKNKHQAIQTEIREIKSNQFLHFNVLEIPGHAPDHIAFWDAERNWLFSGDLLLEHISSNAFIEPDESGKRLYSLVQQRDSLMKCSSLQADIVFSGHGAMIEHSNDLIAKRLERIEDKAQRFLRLIQSGIATVNDLAETYYKKTYYEQFPLVVSEVVSHLDYLEIQRQVNKEYINGVWHYSLPSNIIA
jgi:glyoxylase-like metal-dependent hydrolase (beta-lactamase superfamily II)